MKTSKSHQNKFLRIISIPIRALGKARDCYVSSMTNYASQRSSLAGGMMGGMPAANYPASMPRSFSAASSSRSSDNEDFKELVRAASSRSHSDTIDMNLFVQQQMKRQASVAAATKPPAAGTQQKMPPRSVSVGMGRIDEDKPFGFGEEEEAIIDTKKQKLVYPRSKSYAVPVNTKSLVL
ncbi:hypothetical protein M9H77_32358 [Catharanthus roseus]|uniref:Uncharacterized protein n=1 Tax=Catharanthus roseus TaxID=4058 RepID=A0ACC0A6L1_CATRO|nr:hypothetical protein M9H77_32358 [Catharanthus roseus]